MIGVLRRTVVQFVFLDNLFGSHLQSQAIVLVGNSKTLVSDLIGQIKSNSKFKNPGERFDWSNQI